MSEEHKRKIGLANAIRMKEYWKTHKPTQKQLESYKRLEKRKQELGYVNSPETRKKLSDIRIKAIKDGTFDPKKYSPFVKGHKICVGRVLTKEWKRKIGEANKKNRARQKFPMKDTSIELKIQEFLSKLHLEYVAHKYMSGITHYYQCDIFVPKQETEGIIISKKTIIECDGCYWHGCPICERYKNSLTEKQNKQIERDNFRTKELEEKGYRVIRLWEHEIKPMELNEFKGKLI